MGKKKQSGGENPSALKKQKQRNGNPPAAADSGRGGETGAVYLLRIATVLLAVVSWWSTARGMTEFVFEEGWQAKLASLAVQGILLGMNFYLPVFLKKYLRGSILRWVLSLVLLALVTVTLLCSSWFSYVYIVEKGYEQSCDTKCQVLVRSSYRSVLYDADDYAEAYEDSLRESLGEQITELYEAAYTLNESGDEETGDIAGVDAEEERGLFQDTAAENVMELAIAAMETAMADDASVSDVESAVTVVAEVRAQVEAMLEELAADIEITKGSIDSANSSMDSYETQIRDAERLEEDATSLRNQYSSLIENLKSLQDTLSSQTNERKEYQSAKNRLLEYATRLSILSSGTQSQIAQALLQIQAEMLSDDVDVDSVEEQAIAIFEELQADVSSGAVDIMSASGNSEEIVYVELLNSLDSFISDIQDYASVKESAQLIDTLILELQTVNYGDEDENWEEEWEERILTLQSYIAGMPEYVSAATEEEAESGNGDVSDTDGTALTLKTFTRAAAMDELDESVLLYLTEHNKAEQALIYMLHNPYWEMALLAAFIAVFLDVMAFAVGILICLVESKPQTVAAGTGLAGTTEAKTIHMLSGSGESILPSRGMHDYLYLTGNFTRESGKYYYEVYNGTWHTEKEYVDGTLSEGFYLADADGLKTAAAQPVLLDGMSGGPQDGVYEDCWLLYRDPILCTRQKSDAEYSFLASMDENTPVLWMSAKGCLPCPVTAGNEVEKCRSGAGCRRDESGRGLCDAVIYRRKKDVFRN